MLAQNKDLTVVNAGFATLTEDDNEGLGLLQQGLAGTFRNHFDRFRYQLYQYAVIERALLDQDYMKDKILLESGCARGGGLNFLSQ